MLAGTGRPPAPQVVALACVAMLASAAAVSWNTVAALKCRHVRNIGYESLADAKSACVGISMLPVPVLDDPQVSGGTSGSCSGVSKQGTSNKKYKLCESMVTEAPGTGDCPSSGGCAVYEMDYSCRWISPCYDDGGAIDGALSVGTLWMRGLRTPGGGEGVTPPWPGNYSHRLSIETA
jgi:hypothetical protein